MIRRTVASFAVCTLLAPAAIAQLTTDKIDAYFADWHNATPRTVRGALQERDILTKGDPANPTHKGALLRFMNAYTYDTLAAQASTTPTKLDGQQEIYFVESGEGTITAGGQTADLHRNIAVLVPANLEFTLKSSGSEPLAMYVINEPIPAGFRPNSEMLVRDENKLPVTSTTSLWCHIVKTVFVTADGLGTLQSVLTVSLDPLTIGKPHVVDHTDIEEVWQSLYGTSLAFVSNSLRKQTPGMAFYHVPDNLTPHTNINQSPDEQVKFLYFARYHPHEPRK
jgi:mannose-6-phosphate isomerase-like protein (cupin superfamily)